MSSLDAIIKKNYVSIVEVYNSTLEMGRLIQGDYHHYDRDNIITVKKSQMEVQEHLI